MLMVIVSGQNTARWSVKDEKKRRSSQLRNCAQVACARVRVRRMLGWDDKGRSRRNRSLARWRTSATTIFTLPGLDCS